MDLGLKGKVAVVTGGNTGVGAAAARMLAEEGCHVVVNYIIDEEQALEFVEQISAETGTECTGCYGDISRPEDVDAIFATALKKFGTVDILVNSAAVLLKSSFAEMPKIQWDKTVAVNLTAAFLLNQWAVRYFLEQKRPGRIINLVSQSAFNGTGSGHVHYAATKAGVVGMTRSVTKEVARYGIRINTVSPGIIWTPLADAKIKERNEVYKQTIPIGRIAMPEDVARVIIFLASSLGEYVTGACIDVSGGMTMK